MQKYMRWSGLLVVLALVLAACSAAAAVELRSQRGRGGERGSERGRGRPDRRLRADEFGCVEVAEGEPITLGTALVITTADADLGQDSQYGAQLAEISGMRCRRVASRVSAIEWDTRLSAAPTAAPLLLAPSWRIRRSWRSSARAARAPASRPPRSPARRAS